MAITRHATGSSAPRKPYEYPLATGGTTTTTTKTKTKQKSTTRKPAVGGGGGGGGATKGGRVTKAGRAPGLAPPTHHKRKPSIKDKIEGAVEKIKGKLEGKPGKVCTHLPNPNTNLRSPFVLVNSRPQGLAKCTGLMEKARM
ncbi:hypothetical protein MMC09_006595 [Bachmanniomyces sp. S44760]|nr:hypothetical protein [Bachmanniomyces sp. S44760]